MKHLYNGEFSQDQISQTKKSLRKSIFFLLVCVDKSTAPTDEEIDVNKSFKGLLLKLGGMNQLFMEPPELITVMSLLQAAMIEYNSPDFNFKTYRKLILDAGAEVDKLKEIEEKLRSFPDSPNTTLYLRKLIDASDVANLVKYVVELPSNITLPSIEIKDMKNF